MDAANVMGKLSPDGAAYLGPQAMLHGLENQGNHFTTAAQQVGNIYMDYFNCKIGDVPWQGNRLRHQQKL